MAVDTISENDQASTLSSQRLRELLAYDPQTGVFRWKKGRGGRKSGSVAGCSDTTHGYTVIRIDYVLYFAHHLAWLYVYGEWPRTEVDHKDRCKINNRVKNLRLATGSQNSANTSVRSDNNSGFKGVHRSSRSRRWVAQITHKRRRLHLGTFDTPEEAYSVYCAEAKNLFGEFAFI